MYTIEKKTLTDIADAIREKTGKSGLILPGDMPSEINNISGSGLVDAGYQRLVYIQSDGTQLIDTGVKINSGDIISCTFQLQNNYYYKWVIGAYINSSNHTGIQIYYVDNNSNAINLRDNNVDTRFGYIKNHIVTLGLKTKTSSNGTMFIFGLNMVDQTQIATHNCPCQIYRVSHNDTIYIPCKRKSDNTCGMYNLSNGEFLTDILNGNPFIAGPESILAGD